MSNEMGYKLKSDKQVALDEFYKKYVDGKWVDNFLKIDEKYKNNIDEIEINIIRDFEQICKKAMSLQSLDLKGEIKYIYFSFLRTNIMEDKADYRIDFFDKNWFLDKAECSISIKLDFVFEFLFSNVKELKVKINEFGRSITIIDVEEMKLIESEKYKILADEFLSDIINKLVETNPYKEMKKSEDILIMVGEYMGKVQQIYPKEESKQE